ncbi:DUF1761 domain-containing protein [Algimonas porphyrae]|uniref:DUF1761 domain-containing protein n=1 Tax=Algimonas porphyrae TaxID=1128113 RepID=A0ABQ5V4N8_9PROT|nr:DUF1761 domain-containing protein [Algimonas porphyrae]GLQ21247.1 hypothetical protein GCM10007854_22020 [Algimonas porphyrae]
MPKIFNTSWLAVILATVAFFLFGWLWYGPIFGPAWMAAEGMTEASMQAMLDEMGMAVWLVFALLITLGQAIGVLMVLHLAGAKRLPASLKYAFWLVVTIVAPIIAYACVYTGYGLTGYLIDLGHLLIGYLIMAAIYSAFRGRDRVDA